jgi:SnoaL-like polyketide cyclase
MDDRGAWSQSATPARDLIDRFYAHFNGRQHADAAALFLTDAIFEHAPVRAGGKEGYLAFAESWCAAFPDGRLTIEDRHDVGNDRTEVALSATGTHLGPLDLGGCGIFRPTGTETTLPVRQLFDVEGDGIAFSSLSFDLQEIVQQLVTVDVARLLDHLRRLQLLGARLADVATADILERRNLLDRVGRELDLARHVVRPYFGRP